MRFKEAFDDNKIIREIYNSDKLGRYSVFLIGVICQALAFNLFILQSNLAFGVSGLGVMASSLFHFDPSIVILIANLLLVAASYIYLGKSVTNRTIIGSILYPIFVNLTDFLPDMINMGDTEPVIIALLGAALYGFGTGLIFKTGYTTGGSDVLKQIVSQYGKKTVGEATLYVEGPIVASCLFVFGWQSFIYSLMSLYIVGTLTDKVILGISKFKTFQIITTKDKEIKRFISKELHHGVTVVDSRGGFSGDKKKVVFCTIPTKNYFLLKEAIAEIDKDAFFIVTDTYEVKGGK